MGDTSNSEMGLEDVVVVEVIADYSVPLPSLDHAPLERLAFEVPGVTVKDTSSFLEFVYRAADECTGFFEDPSFMYESPTGLVYFDKAAAFTSFFEHFCNNQKHHLSKKGIAANAHKEIFDYGLYLGQLALAKVALARDAPDYLEEHEEKIDAVMDWLEHLLEFDFAIVRYGLRTKEHIITDGMSQEHIQGQSNQCAVYIREILEAADIATGKTQEQRLAQMSTQRGLVRRKINGFTVRVPDEVDELVAITMREVNKHSRTGAEIIVQGGIYVSDASGAQAYGSMGAKKMFEDWREAQKEYLDEGGVFIPEVSDAYLNAIDNLFTLRTMQIANGRKGVSTDEIEEHIRTAQEVLKFTSWQQVIWQDTDRRALHVFMSHMEKSPELAEWCEVSSASLDSLTEGAFESFFQVPM